MLDLSGIPLRAFRRTDDDPIIIAGGPLAFHPEPLVPFFDAIAVGDGEELFPEILEVLKSEKARRTSRKQRLRALGDISGVYLPQYYHPRYSNTGQYLGLEKTDGTLPSVIRARITPQLLPQHYPERPVVPLLEAAHNRVILEIARGCTRGCRFCGPGFTHRPVRERPMADLLREAAMGLDATGFSQVSLLSLSTADYSRLDELLTALAPLLDERQASLSFPSLRPDRFTPQMADRAAAGTRTGLTLAPEAATPRLRAVINKQTSDEVLLRAASLAYERLWKSVKLYFMIGLPTENDDDILAMADLVRRVARLGREFGGRNLHVSLSPFSPKPHTPFEREGQMPRGDLERHIALLKSGLSKYHSVRLEFRDLDVSRIETAIARGDRRTADAIEASFRAGGRFDAWTDGFSAVRWEQALAQAGLDLDAAVGRIPDDSVLPWGHIEPGVAEEFLTEERAAAERAEFTPDCRSENRCRLCGLQDHSDLPCPDIPVLPAIKIPERTAASPQSFQRYRLVYRRTALTRYVAHLDTLDALERALRRLNVPIEFTQGMKPHPRLIASPPLALGMTSQAEYLDFGLAMEWNSELTNRLALLLPPGFQLLEVLPVSAGAPSLGSLNAFLYRASPCAGTSRGDLDSAIEKTSAAKTLPLLRTADKKVQALDARPSIWRLEQESDGGLLIGLKSSGEAMARVRDVLKLLTDAPAEEITTAWDIERLGMWWEVGGAFRSPKDLSLTMEVSAVTASASEKR
jgi:radical SAM-linked protein